jgi:glycosyltransferase involved in cell wall biosynthesis
VTRVLIYIENYLAGGAERFVFDLVNGLDPARFDVVLWSNRNPNFGHGLLRLRDGIVFRQIGILTTEPLYTWLAQHRLPAVIAWPLKLLFVLFRYVFFVGNIVILWAVLGRARPAVLHVVNGGYPGAESCQAALIAARLRRMPVAILTVLSKPFERKVPIIEKVIDKWVTHVADVVVFNSQAGCAAMAAQRGFPAEQLVCIHSASRLILPAPEAVAAQRAGLAAGLSGPLIGMVGALEPGKGQSFLIEAMGSVRQVVPGARLILVGDGSDRARLATLAAECGIADAVTFTGLYTGDVMAVTGTFDLVAFSSLREGLPYAVFEAMALGKPIVASRVGGIPEQIEDGVSGVLVPATPLRWRTPSPNC